MKNYFIVKLLLLILSNTAFGFVQDSIATSEKKYKRNIKLHFSATSSNPSKYVNTLDYCAPIYENRLSYEQLIGKRYSIVGSFGSGLISYRPRSKNWPNSVWLFTGLRRYYSTAKKNYNHGFYSGLGILYNYTKRNGVFNNDLFKEQNTNYGLMASFGYQTYFIKRLILDFEMALYPNIMTEKTPYKREIKYNNTLNMAYYIALKLGYGF